MNFLFSARQEKQNYKCSCKKQWVWPSIETPAKAFTSFTSLSIHIISGPLCSCTLKLRQASFFLLHDDNGSSCHGNAIPDVNIFFPIYYHGCPNIILTICAVALIQCL